MKTDNILKHAYAHWFEDGLAEIRLGIVLTAVGALRALIHFNPPPSPAYYWLSASILIVLLGYGWGSTRAVKAFKARITYPRTGYVANKPRPRHLKRWLVILLLAGILGGLIGVAATRPDVPFIEAFVPITMGVCGAAASVYVARRSGVARFYTLAVLSAGIGIAVSLLDVGLVLGISYFYFSVGLAQVVVGSVGLVLYLRRNRPVSLNGDGYDG